MWLPIKRAKDYFVNENGEIISYRHYKNLMMRASASFSVIATSIFLHTQSIKVLNASTYQSTKKEI